MEKFTLGFIFNTDQTKVLLIHKLKPDWQSGKINGIGGKIELDESAEDCITRECREESSLLIEPPEWVKFALLEQTEGNVAVFTARFLGDMSTAVKNDHEDIEWFDVSGLPENVLSNLIWLIPMAKQILNGGKFTVKISY